MYRTGWTLTSSLAWKRYSLPSVSLLGGTRNLEQIKTALILIISLETNWLLARGTNYSWTVQLCWKEIGQRDLCCIHCRLGGCWRSPWGKGIFFPLPSVEPQPPLWGCTTLFSWCIYASFLDGTNLSSTLSGPRGKVRMQACAGKTNPTSLPGLIFCTLTKNAPSPP